MQSNTTQSQPAGAANLDVTNEIKKVQKFYESDVEQKCFNLLLLGNTGTGKNVMAATTCRLPAHVDSFDKGGSKHLKPEIERGEILVDTRFEKEDPFKPSVYELWKKETKRRIEIGYFERFSTYMIYSSTSFSMAIMNSILKKAGIAGSTPRFTHDYRPLRTELENVITQLLKLPCDFILTGHLEHDKDEVEGRMTNRYMAVGKGAVIIPTLFDEKWVTVTNYDAAKKENTYQIITQNNVKYQASTRIGRGKFELFEKPDIKYLLKKAGLKVEDKPLLK